MDEITTQESVFLDNSSNQTLDKSNVTIKQFCSLNGLIHPDDITLSMTKSLIYKFSPHISSYRPLP